MSTELALPSPTMVADCCILNGGGGAWAFASLAEQLASILGIAVCTSPQRFNYLLYSDDLDGLQNGGSFISTKSILLASDKRMLAAKFSERGVPTPRTCLLENFSEVLEFVSANSDTDWCLKYPTSCGANGHRMLTPGSAPPGNWPKPFVLQEFIRLEKPEVYRTYCAGGELFGWVARRFPEGTKPSPWVAHARGARYSCLAKCPETAQQAAKQALEATGLWDSFGCVDLLQKPNGAWVVLEVGTDGQFNHVDRSIENSEMEQQITRHIRRAFWTAAERYLSRH